MDDLDDLIFTLGDAADHYPGKYHADVLMRVAQDMLRRLRALYEAAWEECEDMREREPVGPSTNPGIVSARAAHDKLRKEAGLS